MKEAATVNNEAMAGSYRGKKVFEGTDAVSTRANWSRICGAAN
jgi:hypothetical protein